MSSLSDSNLLDCSCNGMIALALGSSVYLWNSETHTLVGYFNPSPQPGRSCRQTLSSISSLCWSRDGRVLCIGTRRGEIQVNALEFKVNEHSWWKLVQTNCGMGACVRGNIVESEAWQLVVSFSLWLFSCGMLNTLRIWGVCHHICLWLEPFPGNSSYSAGTGVCVVHILNRKWRSERILVSFLIKRKCNLNEMYLIAALSSDIFITMTLELQHLW